MKFARYDILAGIFMIAGMLLLAENFEYIGNVGRLWPLTITISGIALVIAGRGRGNYGRGMIGSGVYLLLTSALFFYLNLTSWTLMADCWPLFVGFLGASIFASGAGGRRKGPLLFLSLFLILLSLAFFLIFSVDPKLWPTSLLFLGFSFLFLGRTKNEETNSNN
jgi:hypothetical protein